LLFNTAPDVNFLPIEVVQAKAGDTLEFPFDTAQDFEGNNVYLESYSLKSHDDDKGGQPFDDWLTVFNATNFADSTATVKIPIEAESMDLRLLLFFRDDHPNKPLTSKYEVKINVTAIDIVETNFTFDSTKYQAGSVERQELPPPILTIG